MAELSDMSFADPWLREFEGEKKGKTLIVLRKGLGILDELKDEGLCQLQPLEPDKVLTSQLYNIYMKKKIYMIDNELYKGRFPRIDFIDRLISLFEPEKLKIPEKLMLKYVILYSILVSLKARRDFLR